ncbi:MAG TPA: hypothetical protein VJT72_07140, partial [Pseudonocardiaceae bacterium]|nr:hypothetical protein [Pseudonocardiaceae bacterium]
VWEGHLHMRWKYRVRVPVDGRSLIRQLTVAGTIALAASAVLAFVLGMIADATSVLDRIGWAGLASIAVLVFGGSWLIEQLRARSTDRSARQVTIAVVVLIVGMVGMVKYGLPLVRPKAPISSVSSSGARPSEPPVAAVTSYTLVGGRSGWVVPDRGNAPIPYNLAKAPADAVLSSGGQVTVTVQGLTGRSVVLQSITVDVINRSPAMTGVYLPLPTQGDVPPRKFRLNLDSTAPQIVSEPGTVSFPYYVNEVEPEQFVITPEVTTGDIEWRLILKWTSGPDEGQLVLPDVEKPPFRTTATTAARKLEFCFYPTTWEWRPSC